MFTEKGRKTFVRKGDMIHYSVSSQTVTMTRFLKGEPFNLNWKTGERKEFLPLNTPADFFIVAKLIAASRGLKVQRIQTGSISYKFV